jgi:hypothetical protein
LSPPASGATTLLGTDPTQADSISSLDRDPQADSPARTGLSGAAQPGSSTSLHHVASSAPNVANRGRIDPSVG